MTTHDDGLREAAQALADHLDRKHNIRCLGAWSHMDAIRAALRSTPAAPQTDTALTVERLAEALHSAIACHWRAHSGFTARTDREYHEQQASRILRALGEGAGEGVDRG